MKSVLNRISLRRRSFPGCLAKRLAFLTGLTVLAAGFSARPLRADQTSVILFSNLVPGCGTSNSCFDNTFGWEIDGGSTANEVIAMSFTPSQTATFDVGEFAVGISYGGTPFDAYIESDSGGLPGSILGSLAADGPIGHYPPGQLTAFSATGTAPVLLAGTTYWIVIQEPDFNTGGAWNINLVGDNCNSNCAFGLSNSVGGDAFQLFSGTRGAFSISGLIGTPEPASLILLGSGLFGLALKRRHSLKG